MFYFSSVIKKTLINLSMLFWIVVFNLIFSFVLGFILVCSLWILFNNQWLVNIKVNEFCLFILVICFCISSCVILNTVNYLSIKELMICLVFIILFLNFMILFMVSNWFLISFLSWDWLGLMSYFCINFWTSKTSNGLKAILFNKLGDIMFLLLIVYYYFFSCIFLFNFDLLNLFLVCFVLKLFLFSLSIYLLIIAFIWLALFSKSAMIPFSSWLVSAMLAPTPISALLHSSTMVIAGVYFGLLIYFLIVLLFLVSFLIFILYFVFILYSLIWSLFKAVLIANMKYLVAFSTISQMSYMFLCILFFPQYSFYHMIMHGLFKFLLFLISGSLIHVQLNFQLIFKMKVNNLLIKICFILGVCVLILSLSKEGIIHLFYMMISSIYLFFVIVLGGMLTCFYSSKLIKFLFCLFSFFHNLFYIFLVFLFFYLLLVFVNKMSYFVFNLFCFTFNFNFYFLFCSLFWSFINFNFNFYFLFCLFNFLGFILFV